ncbi:hypothetical protein BT93_H0990 [Corymbia citriodora subsp. variegata]|nr:hypothetical protein BT93_H0990 [Corymbia citriodora subsp. variegata]
MACYTGDGFCRCRLAGLLCGGKSCLLRWTNDLRPDIKRGPFTPDKEKLHGMLGNRLRRCSPPPLPPEPHRQHQTWLLPRLLLYSHM